MCVPERMELIKGTGHLQALQPGNLLKTALVAITQGGRKLAARLAGRLDNAVVVNVDKPVARVIQEAWHAYDGFVCVMAAGIVVRAIARLIEDKRADPCVVVVDEQGQFAVSLLGGHLGGGNALARQVAGILGGQAVITTASDILGLTALDLWARGQNLAVEDLPGLTRASARLVDRGVVRIYVDGLITVEYLPHDFLRVRDAREADLVVSNRLLGPWPGNALILRPRNLVCGVGCNRGTPVEEINRAVAEALSQHGLAETSVRGFASIDLKKDEQGLLELGARLGLAIDFYTKDELNGVSGVSRSDAVFVATGAVGVSEPAALLSAGVQKLLVRKMKWKNVTLAIAEAPFTLSAPDQGA